MSETGMPWSIVEVTQGVTSKVNAQGFDEYAGAVLGGNQIFEARELPEGQTLRQTWRKPIMKRHAMKLFI